MSMKFSNSWDRCITAAMAACGLTAILMSASTATLAQQQPPPGGGFPGGFRGGQGGRFGNQTPTLGNMPIDVLASSLDLKDDQKTAIQKIQMAARTESRSIDPRPAQGDPPPDATERKARQEKIAALDKKTISDIEALLTDDQKKMLPDLLKDAKLYNAARIPLQLRKDLALTDDQKKAIAEISDTAAKAMQEKMKEAQASGDFGAIRQLMQDSQKDTHDKIFAKLTEAQKTKIDDYAKAHPQPQRRPGGNGAPPPPPAI